MKRKPKRKAKDRIDYDAYWDAFVAADKQRGILKPGGQIRIETDDLVLIIRAK